MPTELVPVADAATREAARRLITEYLEWVAAGAREHYGLSFDIAGMAASGGRFYLVRHGDGFIGVGGLKRLDPETVEVQRMYVQSTARGLGAGRLLLAQLLADARAMGCRTAKLESLKFLAAAHGLYRSAGFVEVQPYADNSMKHYQDQAALDRYRASAVFMELKL